MRDNLFLEAKWILHEDPILLINKDWTEVEDEATSAIKDLEISQLSLETVIRPNVKSILGEEKIECLQERKIICLGFNHLAFFWNNQEKIPESWKEVDGIYFDGTRLVDSQSYEYVFGLGWHYHKWCWRYRWLLRRWNKREPSVTLRSL